MDNMDNIIDIEDVHWKRDNKVILQQIDWTVRKGEHWTVFGLNGSGKTTLLNMITGYIWPTTGRISVLGHQYGTVDLRELRKRIGWVSSSLQERVHGYEKSQHVVISGLHASIGLYEKPDEAAEQKAYALMHQLGCAHLIDQTYQTSSQGEKQKLLIARALMASPELLILDEACNGLDFISRESLLASIDSLSRQPDAPTMLFVTHHVEEILPLFSHTPLIHQGQVFASGATSDVLSDEKLSGLFGTAVHVAWHNGRAWLSLA